MELLFFVEEDLDSELKNTVKEMAREAGDIFQVNTTYAGSEPEGYPSDTFTEAGEVIGKSKYGPMRDADTIIDEIDRKLDKSGRHVVFITMSDLNCEYDGEYLSHCYGLHSGDHVVISMVRFRHLSLKEQQKILSGLTMHEVGHIFKLAGDEARPNTEWRVLGMHCKNYNCVMRQAETVNEMRRNFIFIRNGQIPFDGGLAGKYYCPDCQEDIKRYLRKENIMALYRQPL